jgi:hypothetical protein
VTERERQLRQNAIGRDHRVAHLFEAVEQDGELVLVQVHDDVAVPQRGRKIRDAQTRFEPRHRCGEQDEVGVGVGRVGTRGQTEVHADDSVVKARILACALDRARQTLVEHTAVAPHSRIHRCTL